MFLTCLSKTVSLKGTPGTNDAKIISSKRNLLFKGVDMSTFCFLEAKAKTEFCLGESNT